MSSPVRIAPIPLDLSAKVKHEAGSRADGAAFDVRDSSLDADQLSSLLTTRGNPVSVVGPVEQLVKDTVGYPHKLVESYLNSHQSGSIPRRIANRENTLYDMGYIGRNPNAEPDESPFQLLCRPLPCLSSERA